MVNNLHNAELKHLASVRRTAFERKFLDIIAEISTAIKQAAGAVICFRLKQEMIN